MARVVILIGAPGAGKGTQANRLSSACSLPHVSTGDLFRENIGQETELGSQAKHYMDEGKLVPDELVTKMLADRVAQEDCDAGYLLDGFPRTLPQAEALEALFTEDEELELTVIKLDVPDESIVERITGRLLCRRCAHIQHKSFDPPRESGICDECGGELYQRSDDAADVVKKRLEFYHEQTEPLVGFYTERGVLQNMDGRRSPDEVFEDCVRAIRGESRGPSSREQIRE